MACTVSIWLQGHCGFRSQLSESNTWDNKDFCYSKNPISALLMGQHGEPASNMDVAKSRYSR